MTKAAKAARGPRRKIEAHHTLWSVVVFDGKDRGLVGLYQTKQEADEVAQKYPHRFALPPVNAWGGKNPNQDPAA
jgi:hypothetical protein